MLQWIDPDTGRRKSRNDRTADEKDVEQTRPGLEYEPNQGTNQEASRITWLRFRELFEAEFAAGRRANTQRNYRVMMDLFQRVSNPNSIRSINERTVSSFVAGLCKFAGYSGGALQASSIKARLQYLHTAP